MLYLLRRPAITGAVLLSWFSCMGNQAHTASSPEGTCLQGVLSCVRLCQTVALLFFSVCPVAGAGFHGKHSKCMSV